LARVVLPEPGRPVTITHLGLLAMLPDAQRLRRHRRPIPPRRPGFNKCTDTGAAIKSLAPRDLKALGPRPILQRGRGGRPFDELRAPVVSLPNGGRRGLHRTQNAGCLRGDP
jgi:hypothetical protein